MSDGNRPSGREIERDLRDLGAGIEYPPTPDLARAVRRRLDEEGRAPGGGFWPSLLSPRWAVPAAALVLVAFALLSPAVRETLPDLLVSGGGAGAGAGGSAARPESGGSVARPGQEAKAGSEAPQASVTSGSRSEDRPESGGGAPAPQSSMAESGGGESAQAGATGYRSSSLKAEPTRAAPGVEFRLRGSGFSSGCDEVRPARDIRIVFRQDGKTWTLATVDADRRLAFDVRLRVPDGAEPGRAALRATPRFCGLVEERFLVLR